MEKYCQNCRQPNTFDAQFCRFCAAPLAANVGGQQQQQNRAGFQNQQWNQGFVGGNAQTNSGLSGRIITSILLSVCGVFLCGIFTGIPGAILGWMELNAINQGRAPQNGRKFAHIGIWTGIAATIMSLLFYGFYFLILIASAGGGAY